MDPLTQGMLGAALPQSTITKSKSAKPTTHSKYQVLLAGFLGMLGGMAADIDVLIYSKTDPLLFLEYHRQFTHSLIFYPLRWLHNSAFSTWNFQEAMASAILANSRFLYPWLCNTCAFRHNNFIWHDASLAL